MGKRIWVYERTVKRLPSLMLLLALFLASCSTSTSSNPQSAQDVGIHYEASYNAAYTLDQLVAQSEIIVIGSATKSDETINMSRNPQDPSQPDPQTYSLGQVYEVQIQRYLKGKGPSSVKLIEVEAVIEVALGTPVSPATIAQARAKYHFVPIKPKRQYIFFLRTVPGYPGAPYFIGAAEPERFDLSNPSAVVPESPWEGAPRAFPKVPADQMLKNIQARTSRP